MEMRYTFPTIGYKYWYKKFLKILHKRKEHANKDGAIEPVGIAFPPTGTT